MSWGMIIALIVFFSAVAFGSGWSVYNRMSKVIDQTSDETERRQLEQVNLKMEIGRNLYR